MSSILSASMLTAAAPEVDQGQSRLEPGNDSISKNVHASTETVQRAVICNQHGSPIASIKSGRSGALRPGNENIPPRRNLSPNDSKQRNRSCSTELNRSDDGCTKLAVSSSPINDPSFGSDLPVEAKEDENILKESISPHRGKSRQLERASGETLGSAASSNAVESAFRQAVSPPTGPHGLSNNGNIHITVTDVSAHPMKRLMSSLGLNRLDTTKSLTVRRARWSLDDDGDESSDDMSSLESCKKAGLESREKAKSSRRTGSRSSAGLGSTIKSLASNLRSGRLESDNSSSHPERPSLLKFRVSHRNSKSSSGENQDPSEGSYRIGQKLDAVAFSRCIRRWEIIQELVSSEQGYVNDLMVLTHVSGVSDIFVKELVTDCPERCISLLLLLYQPPRSSSKAGERKTSVRYSGSTRTCCSISRRWRREIASISSMQTLYGDCQSTPNMEILTLFIPLPVMAKST